MEEKQSPPQTDWHGIFGTMLQLLWHFGELTVKAHYALMSQPPKGDFLLIRNTLGEWSEEFLRLLPDGIRHTLAKNIILELKYTESLTVVLLRKTLGYDTFYKETQNLSDVEVQTFIISAKTPRQAFLDRFGYVPTEHPGVYMSQQEILEPVRLILLNKLSDAPHNAFFKCFASREKEKRRGFDHLKQLDFSQFPKELYWLMIGLFNRWFESEGELMDAYTPEKVIEMGKMWSASLFKILPPKEVLSHYRPEEIFPHYRPEEVFSHYRPEEIASHYRPEEIVSHYQPQEVLGQYKPEERVAGLKPEERVAGLKPEERVAGLKPEERMADLSISELEAYLQKRRKESMNQD